MSFPAKKIALCLAVTAFTGVGLYHVYRSRKRKQLKKTANELATIFDRRHVFIKDPAILKEKIRILLTQGRERIQVISDFDMTLSKFMAYGKPGDTSHGAIEKASCMPDDFHEKAAAAKAKYYPLEFSADLSYEEKAKLMTEWWNTIHQLIMDAGFERRWIPGIVSECNIVLRDGTNEFFGLLKDFNIPLFIISAGIGDIIEEVVDKESTLYSNTKIVANYMDFNEMGQLHGFKGELIHSYNKEEVVNHAKRCFDNTSEHSNVVLLGDTLGDPSIANGMENVDTILKIGFLNEKVDKLLEAYKDVYDIVITEDETMDIINVFMSQLMTKMNSI